MTAKQKQPYSKLSEIPPHIFKNRILTSPVGEDFKAYLRYMLDNYPNDLHYIFKHSQKYIHHGWAWAMTFERWLKQLDNNLKKEGKK